MALAVQTAQDLYRLRESAYSDQYIINERNVVGRRLFEWKNEIRKVRAVLAGEWSVVFGTGPEDALKYDASLKVQNIVRDAIQDCGRRMAESMATVKVDAIGGKQKSKDAALLRAAIAQGYHIANDDEEMIESYGQDLAVAGGAFRLDYIHPDKPYPCHLRLDPIGVFPTFVDTELTSLLYVRTLQAREADRHWPDLNLLSMTDAKTQLELIEFWTPDEMSKTISIPQRRGTPRGFVLEAYRNAIEIIPVAWAKLAEQDGAWRGLFNQAANVNNTMNRLVTGIVDDMERAIYSPMVSKGLLNPEDTGPDASLLLDRNVTDATVFRLQPAPLQGGLFGFYQLMDSAARGGANYPTGRQGEQNQSIISGAGVDALQGGQTSMVKSIQRAAGAMRRRGNEIDFRLDETYLPFEKPLLAPSGDAETYEPVRDIAGSYRTRVQFGVGAALSSPNKESLLMQMVGNGILDPRSAMENISEIDNPEVVIRRIYEKQTIDILMQRINSAPDAQPGLVLAQQLNAGTDPLLALEKALEAQVQAEQQAQQQQMQAAQGPTPQPLPAGATPEEIAAQQTSLQKGGVPGTAEALPQPQPSFAPPPFATISTGR